MKRKFLQIFIIAIIVILIGVLIFFSQKRKSEFELVKSDAHEVMKLINEAAEYVEKAEQGTAGHSWYGVYFGLEKAVLFSDFNQNKKMDEPALLEYNLSENIYFNPERIVFYLPDYELVRFCDTEGICMNEAHHSVTISDTQTGRAMEIRIEHKTGKMELREVVDLF